MALQPWRRALRHLACVSRALRLPSLRRDDKCEDGEERAHDGAELDRVRTVTANHVRTGCVERDKRRDRACPLGIRGRHNAKDIAEDGRAGEHLGTTDSVEQWEGQCGRHAKNLGKRARAKAALHLLAHYRDQAMRTTRLGHTSEGEEAAHEAAKGLTRAPQRHCVARHDIWYKLQASGKLWILHLSQVFLRKFF